MMRFIVAVAVALLLVGTEATEKNYGFGDGPEDYQDLPKYLSTQVTWARPSRCYDIIDSIQDEKLDDLDFDTYLQMMECVNHKVMSIALAEMGLGFPDSEEMWKKSGLRPLTGHVTYDAEGSQLPIYVREDEVVIVDRYVGLDKHSTVVSNGTIFVGYLFTKATVELGVLVTLGRNSTLAVTQGGHLAVKHILSGHVSLYADVPTDGNSQVGFAVIHAPRKCWCDTFTMELVSGSAHEQGYRLQQNGCSWDLVPVYV